MSKQSTERPFGFSSALISFQFTWMNQGWLDQYWITRVFGQPGLMLPQELTGKLNLTGTETEAKDSDFLLGSYRDSQSRRGLWDSSTRKRNKWFLSFPLPSSTPELLPIGSKEEQRDYVFYLAVGNYRLKVRQRTPFFPLDPTEWATSPSPFSPPE